MQFLFLLIPSYLGITTAIVNHGNELEQYRVLNFSSPAYYEGVQNCLIKNEKIIKCVREIQTSKFGHSLSLYSEKRCTYEFINHGIISKNFVFTLASKCPYQNSKRGGSTFDVFLRSIAVLQSCEVADLFNDKYRIVCPIQKDSSPTLCGYLTLILSGEGFNAYSEASLLNSKPRHKMLLNDLKICVNASETVSSSPNLQYIASNSSGSENTDSYNISVVTGRWVVLTQY